jgi:tripartite ATP-independent transporter DctM subunit
VTFVMIPPLALIFLVLGTIFLGIATPTEGGAMGASGALIMAMARRKLSYTVLRQAIESTATMTSFVMFILVGSTVFSLVFRGMDGDLWVEHLLTSVPGGALGFLIVVNVMIFLLAFFLDYFEIAFIMVPLLAPVAQKLGIDLVWFGVLLAVNMQTSFLHPPFGFALFYLRSVAPRSVRTGEIYWGAIPFVVIQVLMIAVVIGFPGLVTGNITHTETVKGSGADELRRQIETPGAQPKAGAPGGPAAPAAPKSEDPGAELERLLKGGQ